MSDDQSRPDIEPEAKPLQPKAKADTQPKKAKADTQPQAKADTQPKAKADIQPKTKAGTQPKAKADTQSDVTTDAPTGTEPDVPPNRLSINPMSRFFDEEMLRRGIGIRFKGKKRTNVQEYCISEGWVTMAIGKSVDRRGLPLTVKSTGPVEAWYEDLGDDPPVASAD